MNKYYGETVAKLRAFCESKGLIEVHEQHKLSILAACEDPNTIVPFEWKGQKWPLAQTGQMHLEVELLENPDLEGCFCFTTSYRQEKNPIPGRHDLIFPMFEFELKGGIRRLINFNSALLDYLGYPKGQHFSYTELQKIFDVHELTHSHEDTLGKLFKNIPVFIELFPEHTSPFFNMRRLLTDHSIASKVDVILHGQETIGSAEREVDPIIMETTFHSISEGKYAAKLFELFGEKRVLEELDKFLSHEFFVRSGGGIGMTRLIRSLNLLHEGL